ncbi:MAG: hypothetical protein RLZZ612_749 [Pseudomonadota bacterium]
MRVTIHQNCYNYGLAIGLLYGLMQPSAWADPLAQAPASSPAAAVSPSASASSPSEAKAAPASEPPPSPVLGGLRQTNPFDANRQLWPDRTPVPPPPPPPPVPTPVTDEDLEIYGVVRAGSVQKALLKLGKRFANVPVGPTGLASVAVGTPLGEFVLAKVEPDQILLQAPGGQQWVRFSVKKERTAKGNAAPMSVSASTTMANPMASAPAPAGNPFGVALMPTGSSSSNEASASPTSGVAAVAPPPPTMPPAAPGSLAAAIAAAQAAQTASGAAVAPAIPQGVNPFEALLKQQQGR